MPPFTLYPAVVVVHLNQWFPNFSWSRNSCGSRTVITYRLVPGKVSVPNIIRSKFGKPGWTQMRHEQNVCDKLQWPFKKKQ